MMMMIKWLHTLIIIIVLSPRICPLVPSRTWRPPKSSTSSSSFSPVPGGLSSKMVVLAIAIVAFSLPAAFCLRPSSCLARHVSRETMAMQAGNAAQRTLAPERSAEMLATSVYASRSLVSMLDTPVLDGSSLLDTGMDTSRSPLLDRLEAMEGFWYSDDFYHADHGREWVQV